MNAKVELFNASLRLRILQRVFLRAFKARNNIRDQSFV